MTHRRIATFDVGLPSEVSWDIYVDYETSSPQFQYIAQAHCLTRTEPCWIVTGYTTESLALTAMNNHVVNYIKLRPDAAFLVTCYPGELGEIVLSVTLTNKTWAIAVVSGSASPSSGTGNNYGQAVTNAWNAVMEY